MDYSEGLDGDVGTHAFFVESSKLDDENMEEETNLVRLEFPADAAETLGVDKLIGFIEKIATVIPHQTGNAGYAFKRSMMDEDETGKAVLKLLPRYAGFDPSFSAARLDMKNHTFTAHWLNFLDEGMAKPLGGFEGVKKALPKAEVKKLGKGVVIRGALMPPIGDMNRKAKDIGQLPEVARLLAPSRIEMDEFDEDAEVFDAMKWLARLDKMKALDWKNA